MVPRPLVMEHCSTKGRTNFTLNSIGGDGFGQTIKCMRILGRFAGHDVCELSRLQKGAGVHDNSPCVLVV